MTPAEALLWRYLKAHHADGLAFRRQRPIGRYIGNSCCHGSKLIVEVDVGSHDWDDRRKRDEQRDRWFENQRYRVLRFTNEDVLRNLEGVVVSIREAAFAALTSLSLPHKGGGIPKISS